MTFGTGIRLEQMPTWEKGGVNGSVMGTSGQPRTIVQTDINGEWLASMQKAPVRAVLGE